MHTRRDFWGRLLWYIHIFLSYKKINKAKQTFWNYCIKTQFVSTPEKFLSTSERILYLLNNLDLTSTADTEYCFSHLEQIDFSGPANGIFIRLFETDGLLSPVWSLTFLSVQNIFCRVVCFSYASDHVSILSIYYIYLLYYYICP